MSQGMSEENKTVSDWSRDGRFLIGLVPRNVDLWVWPLDGDRKPRAFLSTEQFDERGSSFLSRRTMGVVSLERVGAK